MARDKHNKRPSTGATTDSSSSQQTSSTSANSSAPKVSKTLHDGHPLPQLFVFDLDFTLWPFWVDTHVTPSLKALKHGVVADRHGEHFTFYPQVPALLFELRAHHPNVRIAAASRTHTPDLAREMLKLLVISPHTSPSPLAGDAKEPLSKESKKAIDLFDNMEIYPANKIQHFNALHKATKVAYEDMIFFDDEARNRNVEKELDVVFCLVKDGVSGKVLDEGVDRWRKKWGKSWKGDGVERQADEPQSFFEL